MEEDCLTSLETPFINTVKRSLITIFQQQKKNYTKSNLKWENWHLHIYSGIKMAEYTAI